MATSFIASLQTQSRVVWALMLRETKTLFGKHKLGYLWAFIQAAYLVITFWIIREYVGFTPPPGISTPVFLIAGFVPFFMFREIAIGGMKAVSGNRALLAYPQVYPPDIFVARALLTGALYLCVMVVMLLAAEWLGYLVRFDRLDKMIFALILALTLGLSLGTLFSACNLMWITTARIVPMFMRVLFFASGLFYSVESLPQAAKSILFFNPVCHVLELMRDGLSSGYVSTFVSLPYLIGFILVTLFLGMVLERYARRFMDRIL